MKQTDVESIQRDTDATSENSTIVSAHNNSYHHSMTSLLTNQLYNVSIFH